MSSFLKIHELIKSAALFTLCSLMLLVSVPVRADALSDLANQASSAPDVVGDFNKLLTDIGAGLIWYPIFVVIFILACAFADGNSRDREIAKRREEEEKNGKSEGDKTDQV